MILKWRDVQLLAITTMKKEAMDRKTRMQSAGRKLTLSYEQSEFDIVDMMNEMNRKDHSMMNSEDPTIDNWCEKGNYKFSQRCHELQGNVKSVLNSRNAFNCVFLKQKQVPAVKPKDTSGKKALTMKATDRDVPKTRPCATTRSQNKGKGVNIAKAIVADDGLLVLINKHFVFYDFDTRKCEHFAKTSMRGQVAQERLQEGVDVKSYSTYKKHLDKVKQYFLSV